MKTTTENQTKRNEKRMGVVSFICNKIYNMIATRCAMDLPVNSAGQRHSHLEIDRDGQFAAYVNNRLGILIMWIDLQCKNKRRNFNTAKQHLVFFLHDMEHHFVDPYAGREARRAFRWLKAYVRVYPEVYGEARQQRAYEMIARIYQSLGILFPLRRRTDFAC